MKRGLFVYALLLSLYLTSCEGLINKRGIVYDSYTKEKLSGVSVKSFSNKSLQNEMITDSTGSFIATSGHVGCVPKCPDLLVEFSKNGYHTLFLKSTDIKEDRVSLKKIRE